MSEKKNVRRHRRVPYLGPIRITWEDERGNSYFAIGKCIDISESGLRMEALRSVPVRTSISLRAEHIKVAGLASVRHVTSRGAKYILGLQLSQELKEQVFASVKAGQSVS